MIKKMSLACGGALACAVMGLSACSGQDDGETRLLASFTDMSQRFFVAMRRNGEDEASKLGINLSVVDAQSNSSKQTSDLQSAIATGIQGIILAPTDVNALTPAVEDVMSQGIPIITVDRRVDNTSRPVPHVGADNVAGGRLMAEYVISKHPQGARIVLLTGGPGSSSAIDRTTGIHAAIKEAGPKYQIVAEQTGNWQRETGLTVTQNIITSLGQNRPDAIIAENDDMALGAAEALRAVGISGVTILGFDATPEALELVQTGEIAATVEQSPSRQIRTALNQLTAYLRDGTPIEGANITPILITKDNLNKAERLSEVK